MPDRQLEPVRRVRPVPPHRASMNTAKHHENPISLAVEAAGRLEINTEGASLLRIAAGAHIVFPRADVVARVDSPTCLSLARKQVEIARSLERLDVPAARLVPGEQPIILEHGVITFWVRLHDVGRRAEAEQLGELARKLHGASQQLLAAISSIKRFDPFEAVSEWLDCDSGLPAPAGTDELRARIADAMARWPETASTTGPLTLVHGDLHSDNVIVTTQGPVLIDFEDAGLGPAAWDAAPQVIAARRYGGAPDSYQQFAKGYGKDLLAECLVKDRLCEALELSLAAWAVGNRGVSPELFREAEVRVASLISGDERNWTLL